MPNGGSDCCGTCNFNRKNRGVAGYGGRDNPEPHHCEIRNLPIENAFWTYCANHPHHNPDAVRVPLGPVYRAGGSPYGREVWVAAPDTPAIRAELLALVASASADSGRRYHHGRSLTEAAMHQLAEWREMAVVPQLDHIRGFEFPPPEDAEPDDEPQEPRLRVVAVSALRQLIPPDSLASFRTETVVALAEGIRAGSHFDRLPILADALEDAGYADAGVLNFLRTSAAGPNWVVDVLAGSVS